ncbi:MAG: hypothetical protein JNM43_07085 [Planctomycetaceae bacterium]|nr:hypothetical protein [Planctomycetaceae bacterium]
MMRSFVFWFFIAALANNLNSSALAQRVNYEEAPINYSTSKPDNRISQLQDQLTDHTVSLSFDEHTGYLRSLLETLRVPVSSQVLTFGRTSLQDDKISPTTPRAIYFTDDIHLGFVQNGLIEIAVQDSKLGMVFYTLRQTPDEPPVFQRQTNSCLTCHGAARTKNVPGVLIRSVYPDPEGHPVVAAGSFLSTHRSPLSQRWGGWYVTGRHGEQQHLGNFVLTSAKKPKTIDNSAGHNLERLADRFDTTKYLGPHSDLVALMVLEHQTDTLNVLTQTSFEVRHAEYLLSQAGENSEQKAAATKLLNDRLVKNTEQIVKAFLFADEVALTSSVSGTSEFATHFAMNSKRDSKGRSLRDFDLQTRMFKFPCSYLIETPAFRDLPETLREQVLIRLSKFLNSDESIKGLERLSAIDRTAILEILRETVPGFPAN